MVVVVKTGYRLSDLGDAEMRRWFACWMKDEPCNLKYAICSRLIGLEKVDRKMIGPKQFCFTGKDKG